jgi:uncharacterized membrane protein
MTIDSNKTLGGVGAILLVLSPFTSVAGVFSSIVGLVGLILLLIGLHGLAGEYHEGRIFNGAMYGIFTVIIGAIIAAVIFIVSALGIIKVLFGVEITNWTDFSQLTNATQNFNPSNFTNYTALAPYLGAAIIAVVILIVTLIVAAVFLRRSLISLADRSGVHLFATAGLLMLIGACLAIILIGFLLLWIGAILMAVAFFQIRSTSPPMAPTAPTMTSPPPPQ